MCAADERVTVSPMAIEEPPDDPVATASRPSRSSRRRTVVDVAVPLVVAALVLVALRPWTWF